LCEGAARTRDKLEAMNQKCDNDRPGLGYSMTHIILATPDSFLLDAWRKSCSDILGVEIHDGSVFDVRCDALVSPANSFGFMDGGIDAQYVEHFGDVVQDRLRLQILQHHHGELLVGAAEVVETDKADYPFLIAAPTMRVPMALPADTVNPYLATRAALLLVREGRFTDGMPVRERISSICFPGMGTGVGRASPDLCARQMRTAIEKVSAARHSLPTSWAEASEDHQLLYTDKPKRLQH
jgi:O-acetyl-ADP-ribose deacetylase (regulator of RNase III)